MTQYYITKVYQQHKPAQHRLTRDMYKQQWCNLHALCSATPIFGEMIKQQHAWGQLKQVALHWLFSVMPATPQRCRPLLRSLKSQTGT